MLFNSYRFVFAFFPLTLAGYYICRKAQERSGKRFGGNSRETGKNYGKLFLLAASLFFYGYFHLEYLPFLICSMAANYGLSRQMEEKSGGISEKPGRCPGRKKCLLAAGLFLNLGALACLKYTESSYVPLGISFFTFTQIAFLVESYRGTVKGISALSYGVYVSFFPKIMQGPIVLPEDFLSQIESGRTDRGEAQTGKSGSSKTGMSGRLSGRDSSRAGMSGRLSGRDSSRAGMSDRPGRSDITADASETGKAGRTGVDWELIYRNLYLFVLGMAKKVLIADTLAAAVDFGYSNLAALNSWDGLIVMLSYTLQLYFDFSGYCDMAMGIAGMLGICLPLNFDSPYQAENIMEFWKRWHITLTAFFTKYLYIPLGGNRKGRARTYFNCLLVFFLSGIWHGAGGQFVVWGMMHGCLFVLTRALRDAASSRKAGALERSKQRCSKRASWQRGLGHVLKVLMTFLYVNLAWIFFRAPSTEEAFILIRRMASCSFGRVNWELAGCFNLDEFWYVIKVLGLDRWQYSHYILMILILAAVLILVFFGKSAVNYVKEAKPCLGNVVVMAVLFVWCVLSFSGVSSFLYVNF